MPAPTPIPSLVKILARIFCLALLCAVLPVQAESSGREQIAFVHLRFVGETVELVGLKVVPGHLKPQPASPGKRISLQVALSSGKMAWEGWVADPQTAVVEGPNNNGHLVRQRFAGAAPEVTVRVPFLENGQNLRIQRLAAGAGVAASGPLLATIPLRMP